MISLIHLHLFGSTKFNLAFKGLDFQIRFLEECLALFRDLKVTNEQGTDFTNKMKFITGFQISINSLLNLWSYLQSKKATFLFTRRLNQDCLENFFGIVRQQNANCVNPTPIQFKRTFKKLFCVRILNTGSENCQSDSANLLLKTVDFIKNNDTSVPIPLNPPELPTKIHTDYQKK